MGIFIQNETNPSIWSSYRDELLATSLVLIITVVGSFFLTDQWFSPKKTEIDEKALETVVAQESVSPPQGEVQGFNDVTETPQEQVEAPITATPQPSDNPLIAEVPYGQAGEYDTAGYRLVIEKPVLSFNSEDNSNRRFLATFILQNKNITQGLANRVYASIIKDGIVIVPKAALSVSESKVVFPGEQLTFEGRISLIEGTDVKEVFFEPGNGLAKSTHLLR